ncbi:MAG: NYN domain-containing protein [Actinomycetota bacterium]
MTSHDHEPRIACFLDYENLAIGARDNLGKAFDFGPVADALAERGRVIHRKAYADWSYFDSDRRMLTRHQVELVDIPQKMGGSRKNAADIKMAIDAIELALDRDYLSTFVICTGDSDLSPLVQKLRELDRSVIGVGIRQSTSKLLPPACDEFMFYDNLVTDDEPPKKRRRQPDDDGPPQPATDISIVTSTLAGLTSASGTVRSSALKRALLRKDPTFSESAFGFRNFSALLSSLAERGLVEVGGGNDPEVNLSAATVTAVDELLASLLADGPLPLTGLKDALRKRDQDFDERTLGYRNFGSFVAAAEARGVIKVSGKDDARTVAAPKRRRRRSG